MMEKVLQKEKSSNKDLCRLKLFKMMYHKKINMSYFTLGTKEGLLQKKKKKIPGRSSVSTVKHMGGGA